MKRTVKWLVLALVIFGLLFTFGSSAFAATANDEVNITVVKEWEHGDSETIPEAAVFDLMDGDTVVDTLTLTEADNWTGVFAGLPKADAEGNEIAYQVVERTIENYVSEQTESDTAETMTVTLGEKETAASNAVYDVTGNSIVAKKGNTYDVWTAEALTEDEKAAFVNGISRPELNNITLGNTSFQYGEGAVFGSGDETVTIADGKITFSKTKLWSLFCQGVYSNLSEKTVTVTNTYAAPDPEDPVVPEDPTDPTDPEDPVVPTNPEEPGQPTAPADGSEVLSGGTTVMARDAGIPNTGIRGGVVGGLVALILVAACVIMIIRVRHMK